MTSVFVAIKTVVMMIIMATIEIILLMIIRTKTDTYNDLIIHQISVYISVLLSPHHVLTKLTGLLLKSFFFRLHLAKML